MLLRFKHTMLEAAGGSCNNKSRLCSATFGHVQPLWLLGSSMSIQICSVRPRLVQAGAGASQV